MNTKAFFQVFQFGCTFAAVMLLRLHKKCVLSFLKMPSIDNFAHDA